MSRGTARALGWGLARVRFEGAERIPVGGGVLLAANHTAYLDGPLVYGLLPRPTVFLVKAEAFRGPVGVVLRRTGQIPVRRGLAARAPLVTALGTLAAGGVVGVFPEGTRGSGEVERVEHGIAYLALRSGCPVLPVAVHGTAGLLRGRRPPVLVVVGEAVELSPGGGVGRRAVTAAAEQVRVALATHVAATRPLDATRRQPPA